MHIPQHILLGGFALLLLVTLVAVFFRSKADQKQFRIFGTNESFWHYLAYRLKWWAFGLAAALVICLFAEDLLVYRAGTLTLVVLLSCSLFLPIWAFGKRNTEYD